jgi:hypothetical protein
MCLALLRFVSKFSFSATVPGTGTVMVTPYAFESQGMVFEKLWLLPQQLGLPPSLPDCVLTAWSFLLMYFIYVSSSAAYLRAIAQSYHAMCLTRIYFFCNL